MGTGFASSFPGACPIYYHIKGEMIITAFLLSWMKIRGWSPSNGGNFIFVSGEER
jgi:hypothetical protein